MHWVTKPGTSQPEMVRITTQASKELRAIPGVRNFGAHIGQALLADEVVGINFGENWISVDPTVDYDETLATSRRRWSTATRACYRDVQTYLKERIREVLTGVERRHRRAHLRRTIWRCCASKAEEVKDASRRSTASIDLHVELADRDAAGPGRGRPRRGPALRAQAGRCAPGGGHADGRRGGRRHLPGRQGLRRERLEHARDPRTA